MTFDTLLTKTTVKLLTVAVEPGVDVILYVAELVLFIDYIVVPVTIQVRTTFRAYRRSCGGCLL